jgi:hypothetical protein
LVAFTCNKRSKIEMMIAGFYGRQKSHLFLQRYLGRLVFLFGALLLLQEASGDDLQSTTEITPSISTPLIDEFKQTVRQHLTIPLGEADTYALLLSTALVANDIDITTKSFVVLVDRNPNVEILLVFWGEIAAGWRLVGASAISTGLPGRYEHFKTPLGVFDHSLENPDFRAEGTKNKLGVRGYGAKGGRIFDFGWVKAARGWGDGHMGELRLQMHSTDPDLLDPRLGTAQSEGCIRMPAELNEFIDRHAILDADYDRVVMVGVKPWVLRSDRLPTVWDGRYLVVVESSYSKRPQWAIRQKISR